ncbi:MAG: hypothetical protein P8Y23_16890 [Candidatus Lokiarchaeota archaeon]
MSFLHLFSSHPTYIKVSNLRSCIERIENNKVIKKSTRNIFKNVELDKDIVIQDICANLSQGKAGS